jgi:hypothetical protein
MAMAINSARPARLALRSRMAGEVADLTLPLFCLRTFTLDINVDLAYANSML